MGEETLELEKTSPALQSVMSQYQQYFGIVSTDIYLARRKVSGTYKNPKSLGIKVVELRVDVDGRRPQNRLSGDFFDVFPLTFVPYAASQPWSFALYALYAGSFVVENVSSTLSTKTESVLTGPVVYYSDPTRVNDTIEVRIPRVPIYSAPADATVKFYTSGVLQSTYVCPKISEHFRKVTLEIDRFQTATYPPTAGTCVDPRPADLPCEDITTAVVFERAGTDMTVTEDDVLNDPDSADVGSNWDLGELHDLMENRFDRFANTLQWNLYGVVVPRFGIGESYDSGAYGVMFDFGGYQAGDTYHRQGSDDVSDIIGG